MWQILPILSLTYGKILFYIDEYTVNLSENWIILHIGRSKIMIKQWEFMNFQILGEIISKSCPEFTSFEPLFLENNTPPSFFVEIKSGIALPNPMIFGQHKREDLRRPVIGKLNSSRKT